jgi:PhoPQ-activated pathogenicity-related protein
VKDKPRAVNVWQATNPKARDFRLDVIGPAYASAPLKEDKPGVYVARVNKPASGFTAFFVELIYDSGGKYPFKFTTEVSVVPDVLPFTFPSTKR